jgi:hypothetical protein
MPLSSAEYSMCIRPCNKRRQVSFSPCVKLHFSGGESSSVPLDSTDGARGVPVAESSLSVDRLATTVSETAEPKSFRIQCSQIRMLRIRNVEAQDDQILLPFSISKSRARKILILSEPGWQWVGVGRV